MFEHKERHTLLDLLKPPAGYMVDKAVGTTYSVDVVALTAALLAFVEVECEGNPIVSHPAEALQAICRLAGRVHVFVNRARFACPDQNRRYARLLDRVLHEVQLPFGCFHPKVWVIRFRPARAADATPARIRVICSSRNLTDSHYWEAFASFDGEEGATARKDPLNRSLQEFLTLLPDEGGSRSLLAKLRSDLAKADFGKSRQDTSFLWQWPDREHLSLHLPRGARALVVSPFVGQSFLEKVLGRFQQLTLISTQEELDAIPDEELVRRLSSGRNKAYVVIPDPELSMDLHAKLIMCESDQGSCTFIGSANATHSAWESHNCEAMVRLEPGVKIDHFLSRFVFSDKAVESGGGKAFQGWIRLYERKAMDQGARQAGEQLEDLRNAIGRLSFTGRYDKDAKTLAITLDASPPKMSEEIIALMGKVRLAPLSQLEIEEGFRPILPLLRGNEPIVYDRIDIPDLTEFLVIEAALEDSTPPARFTLKMRIEAGQWQDERDSALMRQLLTREHFRAFLHAILFDAAFRPPSPREEAGTKGGPGPSADGLPLLAGDVFMEDLLQACAGDPQRILEMDRAIRIFKDTGWFDPRFLDFWEQFKEAHAEAGGEFSNG
jgi:hypothetical protein